MKIRFDGNFQSNYQPTRCRFCGFHHSSMFRRIYILSFILIFVLFTFGCKSKLNHSSKSENSEIASQSESIKYNNKSKFSIGNIKVNIGAEAVKDKSLPTKEKFVLTVSQELEKSSYYSADGLPIGGTIIFDSRSDVIDGEKIYTLFLVGKFVIPKLITVDGQKEQPATLLAQVIVERTLGEDEAKNQASLKRMFESNLALFNEQILQQIDAYFAAPGSLNTLLSNESIQQEAKLIVLQRIRNEHLSNYLPELRKLLNTSQDSRIVVAASTALAKLNDKGSVPTIIKKTKELETTAPKAVGSMVFAIAEIGGDDAEQYLESLAKSSDNQQLKNLGQRALQAMRYSEKKDQ